MTTARANHTATLLNGGLVLITGGRGQNNAEQSAELYDPATGTFTPTGSMAWVRESHTATLLPSGQVLVVTGTGECDAQLYDPNIGTFSPAGSLDDCRGMQTATLLANGKVLIAGGYYEKWDFSGDQTTWTDNFPTEVQLYYPSAGVFTITGPLSGGRIYHTATRLANGKVLVAGGQTYYYDHAASEIVYSHLSSCEIYDPNKGTFSTASPLMTARENHTAALLQNDKVLIVGGSGSVPAAAELYDPAEGAFVPTAFLKTHRESHTATLLANGQVLIAGGYATIGSWAPLASAEIYDPTSETFVPPAPSLPGPRDAGIRDGGVDASLPSLVVDSATDSGDSGNDARSATLDAPSYLPIDANSQ